MDSLTLVGWGQAAAAATAHHACAANTSAGGRARPQQRPAFEGGNCFAAQHTGQLDPLRAANTRTSLDQRNPGTAGHLESEKMDFSEADRIDDDALNAELWRAIRKTDPPPGKCRRIPTPSSSTSIITAFAPRRLRR